MNNTVMKALLIALFLVLVLMLGICMMKTTGTGTSCTSQPCIPVAGGKDGTLSVPEGNPPVPAISGSGPREGEYFSDGTGFPLTRQQILNHLRTANEVAKEAKAAGHHPFGAVLVAPDGETVLLKQGNMGGLSHAETELSRRASLQYDPAYLWNCTLVTTFEPCVMCSGNIYWANIGNMAYGLPETTLKNLTGASKANPTMSLPSRTVFGAGQKPIRVAGPFTELEDELVAPHRAFWK